MISTGLKKLDEFLFGGIRSGVITDIYGANGTGKTQLLLQICINSIQDNGNVLYLDTTGGFRPERILEMTKEKNILDKITVLRVTNTSEQIKSLEKMSSQNYSLIVIDNITDLFSYEYKTEESIFEKNNLFMRFMHDLSFIAIRKKIPVVVTNMIRNIQEKEIENMKSAIDLYTHIKIHLTKISTKFQGEIRWLNHKNYFYYKITPSGLAQIEDF